MAKHWLKSRTNIYALFVGVVAFLNELAGILAELETLGLEHPFINHVRVLLVLSKPFTMIFFRSITDSPVKLK